MTQELIIRRASEEDSAEIFAIDHIAATSERRRQFIRDVIKDHGCFVACDVSQIAGFGILRYTFFDCGFIPLIYIAPTHRRRGIGSQLIRHLETLCQTPKLFTSTNASNLTMQASLRKLGYAESGVIQNLDDNDPEIVYFKLVGQEQA